MNARAWCRKIVQPLQNLKLPFSFERRRQEISKLTIGYPSCDFHDHATAHSMLRVFGLHNRKKFKINCYSNGPDDHSNYRKQILEQSDQFIDIRELSHIDAARRIYADKVDILVERAYQRCQAGYFSLPSDWQVISLSFRRSKLNCRSIDWQNHYLIRPVLSAI